MNSAIPSWFSSIFFASQKKPLFLLRFCYWTNNIELLWISGVCVALAESAENKSITESENLELRDQRAFHISLLYIIKSWFVGENIILKYKGWIFWWYRDNLSIDMWCDEKKDFLHDIEKLEIKLLFSTIMLYSINFSCV